LLNGDFTWRDDFNTPALSPFWIMLRAPRETWWTLDRDRGRLLLTPRAETLAGNGNPTYLGHRVQHARFTAATSLEVPASPGVSAGLAVFQGELFHYFLAAKRDEMGVMLYLEKSSRSGPEVVGSTRLQTTGRIDLRITVDDGKCTFAYAVEPGAWTTLVADADAKLLTTDVAGGFVGATVGPHVRLDPEAKAAPKDALAAGGKSTFVIVHGAWAGGWEFKRLAEALQADGHTVYRPTLTGQGERVHLASPDVDLKLHIQDVVNFIEWEDLHDVVLVGHSYGGMVATGVADRVASRLKHVIYLDAFLPENGESAQSAMGPGHPSRAGVNGFFPVGDQTGRSMPHVVPQSEKTFTQPVVLEHQDEARKIPTTYILTVDAGKSAEQDAFFRFYERARARGWTTQIMEGDHVVHLTKTKELAQLLEKAL
jgi:pimeloyl-ACP methyl ester carboxylesterase